MYRLRDQKKIETMYIPNTLTLDQVATSYGVTSVMAAMLAIDHVNTNNDSVMEVLGTDQFRSCNVKIPFVNVDSEDDDPIIKLNLKNTETLIDNGNGVFVDGYSVEDSDSFYFQDDEAFVPCAAVGPFEAGNVDQVSLVVEFLKVPLVSPLVSSSSIVSEMKGDGEYSLNGIGPDAVLAAKSLVSYLQDVGRNYIAILYTGTTYSYKFVQSMLDMGIDNKLVFVEEMYSMNDEDSYELTQKLKSIKSLGFRTIVALVDSSGGVGGYSVEQLATTAVDLGMSNKDYMWVLHSSETMRSFESFLYASPDSPAKAFFSGMGVLRYDISSSTDMAFVTSFDENFDRIYNSTDKLLSHIAGLDMRRKVIDSFHDQANDSIDSMLIYAEARLVYDAIVMAISTICDSSDAEADHADDTSMTDIRDNRYFTMYNVQERISTPYISYFESVATSKYNGNAWEHNRLFVYKDGTSVPPLPLRVVDTKVDDVIFGTGKYFILVFSCSGILLSLGFVYFVKRRSHLETIKLSSSMYCYSIGFSVFLYALSFLFGSVALISSSLSQCAWVRCKVPLSAILIAQSFETTSNFVKVF